MTNPLVLRSKYNKLPIKSDGGVADVDWLTREHGKIETALAFATSRSALSFNVVDAGADPTGVRDSTAAIQQAALTALTLDFGGSDCSYRMTGTVTLRNGQRLVGSGATITQTTANTELFNIEGKSDITASGLTFVGIGTDYSESDSNRSVAFYGGTSGARFTIVDCTFRNFGYASCRFRDQTDILFVRNRCIGPGSPILTPVTSGRNYGVLFDAGCARFVIADNQFSQWAQGVRVEGASDWVLEGGGIFDIVGQHGVYVGADCSNFAVRPGYVDTVDLVGIKVQTVDTATGDNVGMVIGPSAIRNTGGDAVEVVTASGVSPTRFNRDVSIVGITGQDIGQDGLNLSAIIGLTVSGVTLSDVEREGVSLSVITDADVGGVVLRNVGNNGVRDIGTLTNVRLHDCVIQNPGQDAVASDNFGVYLQAAASTNVAVERMDIRDDDGNMEYGIIVTDGDQSTFRVTDNVVRGATTAGARFVSPAETMQAYRGNDFDGAVTNEPIPPTVASAASITLPVGWDVVNVSGTTNVTSIDAAGQSNHRVTLVFAGVLTVVDGSNLLLNGSYTTAADTTLTLVCDGTDWYEVARSAPSVPVGTITTVTTTATATGTTLGDATSAAFSVNLPAASGATGQVFTIKKIDASANAVTVDAAGGDLIDGAGTYPLAAQWESITVQSDGANYYIL